jgi:hypothetical protein
MSDHQFVVGFTGTSRGMTNEQKLAVKVLICQGQKRIKEARHGDCIGADEEFHDIADSYRIPLIGHPPENATKRAFCSGFLRRELPKPYLERNHDIVDESEVVLATPGEGGEVLRSGTWATIRYARSKGKPVLIVYPNGELEPADWEQTIWAGLLQPMNSESR